jgi:antitoxin ParD1/3/4
MNVSLTPELERLIAQRVEAGRYATASEVVREALRGLFAADEARMQLRARFEAEISPAVEAFERGEGIDGEAVFEEMRLLIESKQKRA